MINQFKMIFDTATLSPQTLKLFSIYSSKPYIFSNISHFILFNITIDVNPQQDDLRLSVGPPRSSR